MRDSILFIIIWNKKYILTFMLQFAFDLKVKYAWRVSGVSWNQHCDDQHWFVATGLLQLRWGALQVLILNKLTCIWHFFLPSFPFQWFCVCSQAKHIPFQPSGQLEPKHRCVLHGGCRWPYRGQGSDQVRNYCTHTHPHAQASVCCVKGVNLYLSC